MRKCFVIMPIGAGAGFDVYLNRYENIIKPAIEGITENGEPLYKFVRADLISTTGSITRAIIENIYEADAVVADLTDLNPNVFYELGVRHALRQGTILITISGTKLPFDIGDLKVIFYEDRVGGEKVVIPKIQELLRSFLKHTPQDSPIYNVLPTLNLEGGVDIAEAQAKVSALNKKVEELRIKLAISEEVSINQRKTFEVFEKIIEDKFKKFPSIEYQITNEELQNELKGRQQIAVNPSLKISGVDEIPKSAFVLMPFRKDMIEIYKVIVSSGKGCGFNVWRSDEITKLGLITDQITNVIARSQVIIADISGLNANILYEIGIANALGKQLIIISQDEGRLPYDLRSAYVIYYKYTPSGMRKLQEELTERFKNLLKKSS